MASRGFTMAEENTEFGLCWHQSSQWDRLREISDDRDEIEDTYEEWRRNASKVISDFESNGQPIKKGNINPEKLLLWCNEKGIPVNGEARSEYVACIMQNHEE